MNKTALVTGVTGQDGSYLSEFLLGKGYDVYGLIPHRHAPHFDNIQDSLDHSRFHIVPGDMTDQSSLVRAVQKSEPDEVYNLAAQSFVHRSWDTPTTTFNVNTLGLLNLLEACRYHAPKHVRVYQASSSEIFGNSPAPQNEDTLWKPQSPYGVSKAAAHLLAVNYRDSYKMHVSCGILFNHESERRGEDFVTQKIAKAAASIYLGLTDELVLGNLEARRDWGYAPDYVEAMWLMLQQIAPDDYVIGTGESHSVRDFLHMAFDWLDLKPAKYVKQNEEFVRPSDIPELRADCSKARRVLGWKSQTTLTELASRMVERWRKTLSSSEAAATLT